MAVRETPSPHSHPPLSSPVGSRVRSEDAMPSPAPPAQPWSQVSVAPHTQTPLRDALPFESGPWAPLRCPTAGTSMSPLVPLVRPLGAWLELPRPSRWLLRTIRLGYAIQFARRPPKFRGNRFTSVLSQDAPVLRAEVAVLLAKDAIQPGPSSRDGVRALQRPLLHRSQETRWVTSNLGPACSEPGPCQAPVQDVDAETPLSMRPSLRLGCSDRPERRLLPCLDPPSIPLCVQRGEHTSRPSPSGTSAGWGFRSTGKRANSPLCRGSLFSARSWTRSTSQHVSQRSVLSQCWDAWSLFSARGRFHWNIFRGSWGIWHPQPLSRRSDCFIWDRFSVGFTTESRDGHGATACTGSHSPRPAVAPSGPWSDLAFLRAGVPLEQVSRHVVVSTDASATGWGAMCNGHAAAGLWTGPPAAVAYQLPRVAGSMACSAPLQNAATREAYTGPLGQHCDRCVHQPPRRSTLPSHVATRPPSPPLESEASEVASRRSCPRRAQSCSRRALTSARPSGRMATPPRGTPADLETLRGRSGRPVCLPGHVSLPVVFLPVRGDPRYRCTGMQLASGLTQICVSPSEPSRTDPVQGQGGRGASPLGCALLAQSDVVPRTDAPRDSPSLANSSEEGSTFSERGHPLAPAPRLVESPRMVLGRDAEVLSGLPPAVVNTITSARALSTRQAYRLKWNLFVDWCSPP